MTVRALPPTRPGRRRDIAVIVAISTVMIISSSMNFVIAVLAPFLQQDEGLSVFQIGLLTSACFIIASPLSGAAGLLSDRLRPHRAGLVMAALVASGYVLLSLAPTYPLMLVAVLVAGGAMAFSNPATNSIIMGAFPAGRQGVALGWKQAGVPLAALLAGGLVPSAASTFGWRPAVAGIGGAAMLAGLASAAVIRRTVPPRTIASHDQGPALRGPRPALRGLNSLAFLMGACGGAINAYLVLYSVDVVGYSARSAGFVAALAGLSGAALRVLGPVIAERRTSAEGALRIMAPIAVVATAVLAAAPVTSAALVWIGAILVGAGITVFNSLGMLAVLQKAPGANVGAVTGTLARAFYAGLLGGPLMFGGIVELTDGYPWAWAWVLVLALVATAVTRSSRFLTLVRRGDDT